VSVARLRVAVDATSLLGFRTGIGQVTARLIDELSVVESLEVVAYAVTWRGRKQLRSAVPASVAGRTRRFPARLTRLLWPRWPVPRLESWTGPIDAVHATNYVAPPARAPVLVTVADLTFARFPELGTADTRSYERLLRVALDRGVTVHTFSRFVAGEVREHFGLPEDRVVVVSPGLTTIAVGEPTMGRRLAGAERYVLALGTVEPRKNLPVLVRAFDTVADADPDVTLVVAGPDGWGAVAYQEAVDVARHGERIKRLGPVMDEERASLLAGASVLAYPSLYEGFGLPPLEAMQAGVPVVASSAGALPEVLGDAAVLSDPHDSDALAESLTRVLDDDDERARLTTRGLERVRHYTWERAVPEFVQAYRRIASTHRRR
jgi:glycosyltransferase involved in cell wall biosynthesis